MTGNFWSDYLFWNNLTSKWDVGSSEVHLGKNAGQTGQGDFTVAIGDSAGQFNQGDRSVAIGYQAGYTGQTLNSVAIGNNAGYFRQGETGTGNTGNTGNAVAIGNLAGEFNQGANAVAIGLEAGQTGQQEYSVAIGRQSGRYGQNYEAVAIGNLAGNTGQNIYGIAIGSNAGADNQGQYSIAIGRLTGQHNQGDDSIAIGREAGHTGSGQTGQGDYAVAIGFKAGYNGQHDNTIVLNASGSALNTGTTGAFYVKPIRELGGNGWQDGNTDTLYYNVSDSEIIRGKRLYSTTQLITVTLSNQTIDVNDDSPSLFVISNGVTGTTFYLKELSSGNNGKIITFINASGSQNITFTYGASNGGYINFNKSSTATSPTFVTPDSIIWVHYKDVISPTSVFSYWVQMGQAFATSSLLNIGTTFPPTPP